MHKTKHAKIQVELREYRQAASPPSTGGLTGLSVAGFVGLFVSPGGLEMGEKAGVSQAGVWVS